MDTLQIVILALIQGLTEFLPISSSAHLLLPKELLGWTDQGLAFDVAVHVGTLIAVIAYFRRDLVELIGGGLGVVVGKQSSQGQLAWYLVAATIPVCLAGFILEPVIEAHLRTSLVIAWVTLLGALLLWWADRSNSGNREIAQMTLWFALLIGLAQVLALVPGTSRSGITITMGLLLGFNPTTAARFSFLLSIPVIFLGGAWKAIDLLSQPEYPLKELLLGAIISAITAYLTIHFFLKLLSRIGMLPFVIYRLLLSAVLFVMVFA